MPKSQADPAALTPLHQWTHDGKHVLLVKCVDAGGASHGGFVWPKSGEVRGVCVRDYISATRLIKSGKTTWEELERFGIVKPAKSQTRLATSRVAIALVEARAADFIQPS